MSLKQKAISGVKWTTISTLLGVILNIVLWSIVARVLGQEEVGFLAIVTIVLGMASILSDAGISKGLIHFQKVEPLQLDTLYWLNLLIAFGLTILVFLLAPLVADFYEMPALTDLIRWSSFSIFFTVLSYLASALFLFVLFGFYTQWSSLTLSAVLIIGNSFAYSFGKIDHDIFTVLLPGIMAFSGWGNRYSIDEQYGRSLPLKKLPILIVAWTIALGLFFSGVAKYLAGWLQWDSQAVQYHFLRSYLDGLHGNFVQHWFVDIQPVWCWEALDYLAVGFELLFMVAVLYPIWFRGMLWLAILFHFLNLLLLNISFIGNLPIYLLFFWKGVQLPVKSPSNRQLFITLVVLFMVKFWWYNWSLSPEYIAPPSFTFFFDNFENGKEIFHGLIMILFFTWAYFRIAKKTPLPDE